MLDYSLVPGMDTECPAFYKASRLAAASAKRSKVDKRDASVPLTDGTPYFVIPNTILWDSAS